MDDGSTLTIGRPGKALPHRMKLTVTTGPDCGNVVVAQRGAVIGRARQVDLQLTDPSVSSFHVELRALSDGIEVRDLESHNGTLYEGARIDRAVVPIGSVLTLGASVGPPRKLRLDARRRRIAGVIATAATLLFRPRKTVTSPTAPIGPP